MNPLTQPTSKPSYSEMEVMCDGTEGEENGRQEGRRQEGLLIPDDAGSPAYLALLVKMADLHRRKNAGYAGGRSDPWDNFRECQQFCVDVVDGVLVRMSDKWKRIQSLRRNPANDMVNESIVDTLMDLASYALIAVCLIEERFGREYID